MTDMFYRKFEERFYAPRNIIKELRKQYLPFVDLIADEYPHSQTFDAGCGRGEWLELMQEKELKAFGVDLDEGMLNDAIQLGLNVTLGDAIDTIQSFESESYSLISSFHVVEHISFEDLKSLVENALRVLKPGGLLIMETPNPENIKVGSCNFYMDSTHQKPIPPNLLAFLPEYYGFYRSKILRLNEESGIANRNDLSLLNVLEGVSHDYAVIAQKAASDKVLMPFNKLFKKDYGVDLARLANKYDEIRNHEIASIQKKLDNLIADVDAKANEQESRANELETRANEQEAIKIKMEKSLSWRITYPLRLFNPKRVLKYLIAPVIHLLAKYPNLSDNLKSILKRYPALWFWIKKTLIFDSSRVIGDEFEIFHIEGLKIHFAKGPLQDMRGIGRVTKSQIQVLKNISTDDNGRVAENKDVYFFSSIHWCPDSLTYPSVVMIHDVIPMIFPERFPIEVVNEWSGRYKKIAHQASHIITISHASAEAICQYLGIEKKKVSVIYNGVTALPVETINPSFKLPKAPFIVYLGSYDKHKNLTIILQAMALERLKNIELVLIGDNKECLTEANQRGIKDRVHCFGRLSDTELSYVLTASQGLVFPSLYEGFGLPPLEAASLGVRSICSNEPAMNELKIPNNIYCDPHDFNEWALAIEEITKNKLNETEVKEMKSYVKLMSWEDSVKKLISEINRVV